MGVNPIIAYMSCLAALRVAQAGGVHGKRRAAPLNLY